MAIDTGAGVASSIAVPYPDRVVVRGYDLADELIGHVGFTEYFLLLLLGRRPSSAMVRIVDATLVAIAEHGMVPSVLAARMTLAAAPTALQGAVAAGLLGCGEVILGAAESAGQLLVEIAKIDGDLPKIVGEKLTALRQARQSLPGFGHPLHKPEDPRAWRLIAYAREIGVAGRHVEILEEISRPARDRLRPQASAQRIGRHRRRAARRGFPAGGAEGRSAHRARRRPCRAPSRRAAAPDRIQDRERGRRGRRLRRAAAAGA